MVKKKKEEETYRVTFRGLLNDDYLYDRIELYMRRIGVNAIVLDVGFNGLNFAEVEKHEEDV